MIYNALCGGTVLGFIVGNPKKMKNKIFEYRKSSHFLFNQWSRKLDDSDLIRLLPFVDSKNQEKTIALLFPSFLSRKGFSVAEKECLVLVIKNQILITLYWTDHPDYLFKKERSTHFQLLY